METLLAILANQNVQIILGGALGGVARWVFLKDRTRDGVGAVLLGAIMGFYVSPFLAPGIAQVLSAFAVDPDKLPGFAAFTTGVGGITILGFGFDWVKLRFKAKQQEQPTGGPGVVPPQKPDTGGTP